MSVILNARCYICNQVSSELIETHLGDHNNKRFFRDSHDSRRMVCEDCLEEHEKLMFDYELKDGHWNRSDNDNVEDNPEVILREETNILPFKIKTSTEEEET